MTTDRAKDFQGTLRQLLRAMNQYKLHLAVVVVFAILSTIFNIAGPKVLAQATTALATGWVAKLRGTGSIDFVFIGRILLILLGMYLLSSAFSFVQSWLMSGLSQKVCYDFRRQISEKINRLPLAYFEKRTVGEVLSRITNDVDTLGQSLNQSITQLITSVTTMIGVLIMMLSISARMTLIALLILPVSLVLVMIVVHFSQRFFKAQQATLGVVNGQVAGQLGVARRDGGQQLAVLLQHERGTSRVVERLVARHLEKIMEVAHHGAQGTVLARPADDVVKPGVKLQNLVDVVLVDVKLREIDRLLQVGELLGRDALRRKPRRQPVKRQLDGVDVVDILLADAQHNGPLVGDAFHKPFQLELAQRLAQGCAADAKLLAQILFGQIGAGRILPVQDILLKRLKHTIAQVELCISGFRSVWHSDKHGVVPF